MSDKKSINQLTYVLNMFAILTLFVLVGIYFGIGFLPESQQTVKNLVQSLISDISAVLIIFLIVSFFLDRKGLSPSSILKEDLIGDLLARYPTTKSFLNSTEATSQFNIVEKLKTSKEIYLTGWSLVLFQKISHHILDAIVKNKIKIKILITEPKSSATKLFRYHQKDLNIEHDIALVMTVIESMKKELLERTGHNLGDSLEIRFCSWVPSCSLMFADPKSENASLRLMIYPLSIKTNHTSIETYQIINKKEEPVVYQYFLNEFETLWLRDSISEEQLKNKLISKGIEVIETTVYESYLRDKIKPIYEYKNIIEKSKTIDIVGYTCKTILDECRTSIVQSVLQGNQIRIVITEPKSLASQLVMENSRLKLFEGFINDAIERAKLLIKDIEEQRSSEQKVGTFEIRFINWLPSFALFLSDRELESGSIKITLHHMSYFTPDKDPAIRKVILKSIDPLGFSYLCGQFHHIWEKSISLDEVNKKI